MAATLPARRVVVRVRQNFLDKAPPEFVPILDGGALQRLTERARAFVASPSRPSVGYTPPVPSVAPARASFVATPSGVPRASGAPRPRALRPLSEVAANLAGSFSVEVPPGVDSQKFAEAIGQWEGAESTYVAPDLALPSMAGSATADDGDPDWFGGLGVPERRRPTGKRVAFVDLEWGFGEHVALPKIQTVHGSVRNFWWHGNAVLGIVVGQGRGVRGLVPKANAKFASPWTENGAYDLLGAIAGAASHLDAGDVLLIEVQARCGEQRGLPVEVDPAVQDLLALLRHLGIIVVEAAGNGGHNLDEVCVVGRGPGAIGDSGALLVGAYRKDESGRLPASNYGSRVPLWARGEAVTTAWSNPIGMGSELLTDAFDGTSAAAAMVAGVVLAIQSEAKRRWCWFVPHRQPPLTPEGMEQRLFAHGRAVPEGWIPNLAASLQDLS